MLKSFAAMVVLATCFSFCGCAENDTYRDPAPKADSGTVTLVIANNEIASELHIKIDKKEAEPIRGPVSLMELKNPPRNETYVRRFKLTAGTYHTVEVAFPAKRWNWKKTFYVDPGVAQGITVIEGAVMRATFSEPANADEIMTAYFDALDAEYERQKGTRRIKEQP